MKVGLPSPVRASVTSLSVVDLAPVALNFGGAPSDWPEPTREASRHERVIARELQERWARSVGNVSMGALESAVSSGDAAAILKALRWSAANEAATETLSPLISKAFVAGVEVGAGPLRGIGVYIPPIKEAKRNGLVMDLAGINDEAVAYAEARAASLVVTTAKVRREIRKLVVRSQRGEMTPTQLARAIREVIGLDKRRVTAASRFAARLADEVAAGTLTAERMTTRLARYTEALRRQRALVIARTESIDALNGGQQVLWQKAVAQGVISSTRLVQKWIVTRDELLCEKCEPLADAKAEIGAPFPNGKMRPPAHPSCRCAVGLVARPKDMPVPR